MTRFLNSFEVGDVVVAATCGQRPRMAEVVEVTHGTIVAHGKFGDGDDLVIVFPIEHVRLLVPGDSIYLETEFGAPGWAEVVAVNSWDSIIARVKSKEYCCMGSFVVGDR